MIKGISTGSKYITITGGNPTHPYISPGSSGAGMIRWNPNMNCMEISDGGSWKMLETTHANVELNHDVESAIEWAIKRMKEEEEWLTKPSVSR